MNNWEQLIRDTAGMTTPSVLDVINEFVSKSSFHLEVGVYMGASLIGALTGNKVNAIAVDNFSEFDNLSNESLVLKNFEKFGVSDRVKFFDMDFREFFKREKISLGSYYYDGAHDFETEFQGFELGWEWLDVGGVMMVDDLVYSGVDDAVKKFMELHKCEVVFERRVEGRNDPIWWNGFIVLKKL